MLAIHKIFVRLQFHGINRKTCAKHGYFEIRDEMRTSETVDITIVDFNILCITILVYDILAIILYSQLFLPFKL